MNNDLALNILLVVIGVVLVAIIAGVTAVELKHPSPSLCAPCGHN